MRDTAIYKNNAAYARDHNELEAYRASYRANMDCAAAISQAINDNYANNTLNTDNALKTLRERFSLERIAVITAITIRDKDWDGRFSSENKAWAKSFPFPRDSDDWGQDRNAIFRVTEVHTVLLDLFADGLRRELALAKTKPEKKPSLVDKISRPIPKQNTAVKKNMEQEI